MIEDKAVTAQLVCDMDKQLEERARQASIETLERLSPAFEEGYIKGATEQQAIDNDKALDAFCMTECQRKEGMPCAHLADGGCTNYRKFKQMLKGGSE